MQDNGKKPALRFKGFTDPWEQRKLGEICDFITKGATPTTYGFSWQPDGVPFFRNDSIKDNVFVFGEFSYISEAANEVLKRSEVHGNDILIAITGDIGKVGIIPDTVEKANINQHIARVRIRKEALPYFVYQYLASDDTQKEYQKIKTGLSMPQLSLEQVRDIVVKIPEFNEQGKIADCLRCIDTLITLHQRKYEKLVNIKKSMLDKMFPQNGASVPEIRFKGFTDPWEQRKLGEMVDVCSGMDYKHLSEGDIPVYGTGGYMLSVNKALSYDRNAVGIGRKGTIDKPYILKAPFWTVDTLFYAIPKDSKNIDFTFDVFQKVDWKKKDESTGVPSLSKIAINETSISTPSKLEQERIGSFFLNLDTLITLHQRKLEKLQNIKKSCLEKMFV